MKRFFVLFLMLAFFASSMFSVTASAATATPVKPSPSKLITITGDITKLNPGMPYNKAMPAIITKDAKYILSGNIQNIEKYVGYSATMSGYIQVGPQGIQFFNVLSYKILKKSTPTPTIVTKPTPTKVDKPTSTLPTPVKQSPTPTPTAPVKNDPTPTSVAVPVSPSVTILKGYLDILDPLKARFILKTEKGAYELIGNVKGLENEAGKQLEVGGNYVYTLVATEFPLFSVQWFKEVEQPTPTVSPAVTTITEKDNGGYVYVKLGSEVKLVLSSNPTTGYSWQYDQKPDPNILLQTNYEYLPSPMSSSLIVGAGGSEVWTFKTVNIGTTVMYLSYLRPWESVTPAQNFKVKVIVEPVATATPVPTVTPVPTPTALTELKGILVVSKVAPDPTVKMASPYTFTLKSDDGPYTLHGNVAGLEGYDGQTIL
ncbi:MAG: protease inhibitor I42 family protein, partial [Bacillota bacterium]|nr:protease inhibitor I42 family protein [Bacillota bacterium]